MRSRRFTLFEMLVVGVILLVVAGVTLPMLTRIPGRIEAENALRDIRHAFLETSTRARALGTALSITLYEDEHIFVVGTAQRELPPAARRWVPPVPVSEEYQERISIILSSATEYELSTNIEWNTEERDWGEDYPTYTFFEDGQASGGPLRFSVAGHHYQLDVDALTGEALIEELED